MRHLENRGQASACLDPSIDLTPLDLSFAAVNERWHYCKVHFDENNAIAIAATASRIVILKFDTTLKCFKPVRALDTATPVSTIHFTQHTAIVSSDKFFEIDLTTYGAEEFLDMSDSTLREARNYSPMFATKINSQEFLLCFKECGIFVDEYGCRSRPEDLNWLHKPTGFTYREPLLFITHADSLQVIKIGKSFTKELTMQHQDNQAQADTNSTDIRAILHIPNPKIITDAGPMGIYVLTKSTTLKNGHSFELLLIEGNRLLKAHLGRSMETLSSSMSSLQTAMSSDTVSTTENYL
jgi:citron Rho-interacting kinase